MPVDFIKLDEKVRKPIDFDFCQMFVISKNKSKTLGKKYKGKIPGLKNLW
jgi:hypothetical protein